MKDKVATGSAAPAAQTNSAIGNTNVSDVKVNDLNNPPKVATPEAVKNNPNAKLPQTPTPSVSPKAGTTGAPISPAR